MGEALRPLIGIAAASGALAIAVLSFTGAIWPYAPDDEGRAYLAFANAFAAITFFSCVLILISAVVAAAHRHRWRMQLFVALSAIVFLVGFVGTSFQLVEAMNTWFEQAPRMGPGSVTTVRLLSLCGVDAIFLGLAFGIVELVRRLRNAS
ncbi:hypothetical protein [Parvularcula maris]|uniref:Uncharacterized protein n=1 Tax=Parvularcula maris TaxID=2965077 RepID=A0A9X2L9E2_9PROT|nr:hypothetical protein [Parvularcula maris]MCQ8185353.1 hypothetical protein [Parvularcula maris]